MGTVHNFAGQENTPIIPIISVQTLFTWEACFFFQTVWIRSPECHGLVMLFLNLVLSPATLRLQNHILLTGFPFPHFHLQMAREENWRHKSKNHGLRQEQFKANCKERRKQTVTVTILIIKAKKKEVESSTQWQLQPPKMIPPAGTNVTSPLSLPVLLHWKRNTQFSDVRERVPFPRS